ncbi:MAG: hypothetical protein LBG70_00360, partial [Bifidobacteriaceae bacterium]|nr:hypothetical protein [Bifidobacteriaceae bacterium]
MPSKKAAGAVLVGCLLLAALPVLTASTQAGPDASVRVVDAPALFDLSQADLTSLGFGGSVPTADWLLPGVCGHYPSSQQISLAGPAGQVEDLGAPQSYWDQASGIGLDGQPCLAQSFQL